LKDKKLKKRAPLAAAVFHALSNKKKIYIYRMKDHREFLEMKLAIFDPCLVDISLKLHDIRLKILP